MNLVTFIRPLNNIIKNHTKAFRDIRYSDILISVTIDYSNNYICH